MDNGGFTWKEAGYFSSLEKAESSLREEYELYNECHPTYMVVEELAQDSVYPGVGGYLRGFYKNNGACFVKWSLDSGEEGVEAIKEFYNGLHRYG